MLTAMYETGIPHAPLRQDKGSTKAEFALVANSTELSTRTNRCAPTQQEIPEGGDGRPERRRLGRDFLGTPAQAQDYRQCS